MRFGVNAVNFGAEVSPESLRSWASTAEDLGFDFLMISDHLAITDDVHARYPAPYYDPILTLGYLAGITKTIRLGTTVLVLPYRHPLYVARLFANLDQFSQGRMILGVGAGWSEDEFTALGADFHRRGELTDEYLDVITSAWTNEEIRVKTKTGASLTIHTAPLAYERRSIPIWVGGASNPAIKRAVRYGAWHPIRPKVGWLENFGIPRLREIASSSNKQPPPIKPRIQLEILDEALPDEDRLVGQGSVAQIRDDLRALEALGITDVLLDTSHRRGVDHAWHFAELETFAETIADLRAGAIR